jgi:Adaptin N terminal region
MFLCSKCVLGIYSLHAYELYALMHVPVYAHTASHIGKSGILLCSHSYLTCALLPRYTCVWSVPGFFFFFHRLDPDTGDSLIEIMQTLLNDRIPMVLGSTVASFSEVCPDRFDLIHPHFRKLCKMIADTDEWGQVAILNMLTRYGRDQFVDPDRKKVGSALQCGELLEGRSVPGCVAVLQC